LIGSCIYFILLFTYLIFFGEPACRELCPFPQMSGVGQKVGSQSVICSG